MEKLRLRELPKRSDYDEWLVNGVKIRIKSELYNPYYWCEIYCKYYNKVVKASK